MTGRLFTAPLFVAVILLSQCNFTAFRRIPIVALFAIVIVVGVITYSSPLYSDKNSTIIPPVGDEIANVFAGYISDERVVYYAGTGLLNNLDNIEIPRHPWATWGSDVGARGESPIFFKVLGMYGFYAGPEIHIIDHYTLADPLRSKLPIEKDQRWMIGHFTRTVPPGYMETLQSGENVIEDKCLAKYYDKLSIITRGDLFDANRIQEIWKMNTGQYDYLLEPYIHGQENFQNSEC